MYIKDKERVFKCIPLYSMYCFSGNPMESTNAWKQINYDEKLSHSMYEYNKWENLQMHDYV